MIKKDGTLKKLPQHYTHHEKITALGEMALNGKEKAAEITGVPRDTLNDWAYRSMREDYQMIRPKVRQARTEREAEERMEIAARAGRLESRVHDKIAKALDEDKIEARDLSKTSRDLATESGIHTSRALDLRDEGQPTVTVTADVTDVIKTLVGEGMRKEALDILIPGWENAIEGEAEEVKE